MGNCIRCESAVYRADDEEDWVREEGSSCQQQRAPRGKEGTELLQRDAESVQAATEVRIKISKKKLEELLRYADTQGLPLHQLLAHLVSAADHAALGRGRHWRPSLDSIPEVAE